MSKPGVSPAVLSTVVVLAALQLPLVLLVLHWWMR